LLGGAEEVPFGGGVYFGVECGDEGFDVVGLEEGDEGGEIIVVRGEDGVGDLGFLLGGALDDGQMSRLGLGTQHMRDGTTRPRTTTG
jgi:hypothetical protein